jgi:hypothetical protein
MISEDKEYDLPSFNINDKNKIKEFNANPVGTKYQIAHFSFYENCTILEIQCLKSADEYNIQTLKELIEKVIPKLSRNRTEDNSNGIKIKTRTDRKKKTLIEEEKPKQYYTFKGSKFSKSVERDFEDDKLTDIRTKSDIHLQSNPEEDAQTLGATDFYFKSESNIKSYEWGWDYYVNNGNGNTGRVVYLTSASISPSSNSNSTSLFSRIFGRHRLLSEKNKPIPNLGGKRPIPADKGNGRRLGQFSSISADKTFNIGKYDVLGQTVTVKYHVGVSNGNPFNEIIIDSKLGKTTIGNTGVSLKGSWSKSKTIFTFVFPSFPAASLNAVTSGTISWSVSYTGSGKSTVLSASLSGTVKLGCEIKAGWDIIASLSAGIEGIIVSASGSAAIKNKSVEKKFSISAGKIYAYLDRSILGKKERLGEKTMWNGW